MPFVCLEVIVKERPLDFSHVWSFTSYAKNAEHQLSREPGETEERRKEARKGRKGTLPRGLQGGRVKLGVNTRQGFHFRMHELVRAIQRNNLRRLFYARLVSSFAFSTFLWLSTPPLLVLSLFLFFFPRLCISVFLRNTILHCLLSTFLPFFPSLLSHPKIIFGGCTRSCKVFHGEPE